MRMGRTVVQARWLNGSKGRVELGALNGWERSNQEEAWNIVGASQGYCIFHERDRATGFNTRRG